MVMFIELEVPKHDPVPNLWYVLARHDRIYLTKHGDLEHEDFIDMRDMGKIYYDTEVAAFKAVEDYYRRYNKHYPYITEHWAALQRNDKDNTTEDDSEIVESKVMEFE